MARTEQLNELLSLFRKDILNSIHTVAIAKVTAIRGQKTIDCQIVTNLNAELKYPNFSDVPVYHIGGGDSYIAFPIKVGDYCILLTFKQPIENFRLGKDFLAPSSRRQFDCSDVVALVGIKPDATQEEIPQDNIVYKGKGSFIGNQEINGNVTINGDLQVSGDLKVNGDLICDGNITAQDAILNNISFKTHVHGFIDANGVPKITQGPQ